MQFGKFYYLTLVVIGFHMFYIQIHKLVFENSKNCLKIFKSNNLLGFIVLISVILGKTTS